MKRILVLSLGFFVLLVFAGGCASPGLSSFRPSSPVCSTPKAETIYIHKVQEARPLGERSRIGIGFLAWIPLVPYAAQQIAPEALGGLMRYDFKGELGATITRDLAASGVAQNLIMADSGTYTQNQRENTYHLDIQLEEGVWHRNITMYGLSLPGFCLCYIGVPVSYGSFDLGLKCSMKDSKGTLVGETLLSSKVGITEGLYYNTMISLPEKILESYSTLSPQLRTFVVQKLEGIRDKNMPLGSYSVTDNERKITASENIATQSSLQVLPDSGDIPVRIKRLKELKESGVLTEEEYQAKRKALVEKL